MKKLVAEQSLKKEHLSGLFLVLLIALVVALSVVRVVIANRLVEASEKLQVLDKSIAQLETANQNLSEELRGPESISQIEEKAKQMGFTRTYQLVFITASPQIALETDSTETLR